MSDKTLVENAFGHIVEKSPSAGMKVLDINHRHCKASISLYGGQVLSWQPTGQRPILWLSDASKYEQGSAIRGGVPLCWPWFGANTQGGIVGGNHGFARQMQWQIVTVELNQESVCIVLQCQGENQAQLWPHPFRLEQRIVLGKYFEQELTMVNLSGNTVKYTGALHSYFQVSSPLNVTVGALNGSLFYDKLTDSNSNQDQLAHCFGPLDRVYDSSKSMVINDSQWQRKIEVTSRNCAQWVLWNPGTDTANNMADIHHNGEHEFVCLEAANTQWQSIAANDSTKISQTIRILS